MAPLPRVLGTLSDSTKLKFSNIANQLWETKLLALITDNFDSLDGWTETDPDGKVNLGTNVVTMDGAGSLGSRGLTRSVTRANGYFEVKCICPAALVAPFALSIHNASALPSAAGGAHIYPQSTTWSGYNMGTVAVFTTVGVFATSTTYTLRGYVNTNPIGAWTTLRFTVTGGAYTTETEFYRTDIMSVAFANPMYVSLQRNASSPTNLGTFSEFRWYSGYATDAPYVTYTHDAGSGKVFNNLDFTAFAMPGTVPSTNLTFAYSFDDGVESYSAALTLAQLNAVGKLTADHRYIRIRVYANSDGSTLVYGDKPQSDTATDGVGDFPAVTSVVPPDTVQGVTGTFPESTRNTDPGVAYVASGRAYKILNVDYTGTLVADGIAIASATLVSTTLTLAVTGGGASGRAWIVGTDYQQELTVSSWGASSIVLTLTRTLPAGAYRIVIVNAAGTSGTTAYTAATETEVVNAPSDPVHLRIIDAVVYQLKQIKTDSGYNYTIRKAFSPPRDLENENEFPCCNVDEGPEDCANQMSNYGDGNNAMLQNSFTVVIDAAVPVTQGTSQVTARARILADLQKLFGTQYYIRGSDGARTAFNCIYEGSEPWGQWESRPVTGVTARFKIWYRQRLTDPTVAI